MKKRIISLTVGFVAAVVAALVSTSAISAYAAEKVTDIQDVTSDYIELPEVKKVFVEDDEVYTNDDLFEMYANKTLGIENESETVLQSVDYSGNNLSGVDKFIYDIIKPEIEDIANGKRDNAKIEITATQLGEYLKTKYTKEELGVSAIRDSYGNITSEANIAISNKIYEQSVAITNAQYVTELLNDCSYELYWYRKIVGGGCTASFAQSSYSIVATNDSIWVDEEDMSKLKLTIGLTVDSIYRLKEEDRYSVDTKKTGAAKAAADNAKIIVDYAKNNIDTDYDKLVYYKNQICDLNTYNYEAAGTVNPGDMSPWQIIYVFDGNSSTNVVCEGYAKAFAYLCELTEFNSNQIRAYTVSGDMSESETGSGPHMWNIVRMDDEHNYMVDVTNCDGDSVSGYSVGYPDNLFLRGYTQTASKTVVEKIIASDGTESSNTYECYGYKFAIDGQNAQYYIYDKETMQSYGYPSENLQISASDYSVSSPSKGEYDAEITIEEPTIEETGCTSVTLMPKPLDISEDYIYEYSIDGFNWQTSNVFDNLERLKVYAFHYRVIIDNYLPLEKAKVSYAFIGGHDFSPDNSAYACSKCAVKNIAAAEITKNVSNPRYTGDYVVPSVEITDNGVVLTEGTDYIVEVTPQKDVKTEGAYSLKITGKGNYAESISYDWNIEPNGDPNCEHPEASIIKKNEVAATCEVAGKYDKVCSICNAIVQAGVEIPAQGHQWSEDLTVDVKPTCEKSGSGHRVCKVCNKASDGETLFPTGHDFDEGVITKQPTEKEKGERVYTCRNDASHKYTEEIPALSVSGDVVDEDLGYFTEEKLLSDEISIIGVSDSAYTGSAITFDLRVYKGNKLLKEGVDYTISYKNNLKAFVYVEGDETQNLTKIPKVKVTGKGAYKGQTAETTFNITPINMNDSSSVLVTNGTVVKSNANKPYKPVPSVTINGKKLKNKTDFTVEYENEEGYTESGTYSVSIIGKGNYEGNLSSEFTIVEPGEFTLISKASVSGYKKSLSYFGETWDQDLEKLKVTINKGGKTVRLVEGEDYSVSFVNNNAVGTASMIIRGTGDYVGEKVINYTIKGKDLKSLRINYEKNNHVYTGKTISPEVTVSAKYKDEDGEVYYEDLSSGSDYSVSYMKNVNAGTATIVLKGMGGYTGTVKKSFKIKAYELTSDGVEATVTGDAYLNSKGKYEVPVRVTNNGKLLVQGVDYTLSFKNNKKYVDTDDERKMPTVTIKGKGNYAKSISRLFVIPAPAQ